MSGLTQALGATNNLKVGVCDVAESPVGTVYNDTTGLWFPVGVIEPGTFKSDMSRKLFDFKSGIPETIQASYPIEVMGKTSFDLVEINGATMRIAAGGVEPIRTYGTPSTTVAASPAQSTAAGATTFGVTAVTNFTVGMYIEIQTSVPGQAGLEYGYVTAVGANTLTVMPQLLGTAVATTGTVKAVASERIPVGTSTIRYKSYRLVFNAADFSQVVLHVLKARADGVKPNFPQGKNMSMPVALEALGVPDTTLTPPQPVVAQMYYLPPGNTI